MKKMIFENVTSEQAMTICSHFRAIALAADNMSVQAFVMGSCVDAKGESVFLNRMKLVYNIPVKKYWLINVDGQETKVRFDHVLTLEIVLE